MCSRCGEAGKAGSRLVLFSLDFELKRKYIQVRVVLLHICQVLCLSSKKQAVAFFFGLLIKKICLKKYSGSCCASAYLSGAPLREEKGENSGQRWFFGLCILWKNIDRFVLSYCISVRCCPCEARSRPLLFSLDFLIKENIFRFLLCYCISVRFSAAWGKGRKSRSTLILWTLYSLEKKYCQVRVVLLHVYQAPCCGRRGKFQADVSSLYFVKNISKI